VSLRLIRSDIPTDDLEAAQTNLGIPGSVVQDENLDAARTEVRLAIEACDDGDAYYEERLETAVVHVRKAQDNITELVRRINALGPRVRWTQVTARNITIACGHIQTALDEWLRWAEHELDTLD